MNESGRSVTQAMRFYKLQPADLVVIYDELDLPPGKLRMKTGGGNNGHNGIRSIESAIGKDFRRMRLGIGHPGAKELVNGYVLHDFAKSDADWLSPLLDAVAAHAPLLAKAEDSTFMNRVHLATAGEEPAPAEEPAAKAAPLRPHLPASAGNAFSSLKKLFGRDPS
jgi:PTH1 family peptidyl-tRNA hydrolase